MGTDALPFLLLASWRPKRIGRSPSASFTRGVCAWRIKKLTRHPEPRFDPDTAMSERNYDLQRSRPDAPGDVIQPPIRYRALPRLPSPQSYRINKFSVNAAPPPLPPSGAHPRVYQKPFYAYT